MSRARPIALLVLLLTCLIAAAPTAVKAAVIAPSMRLEVSPGGPYQSGQTLTITARGLPSAQPTLSIGPHTDIPLRKIGANTFTATYRLGPSDTAPMRVTVAFQLSSGEMVWLSAPHPVNVPQVALAPPPSPYAAPTPMGPSPPQGPFIPVGPSPPVGTPPGPLPLPGVPGAVLQPFVQVTSPAPDERIRGSFKLEGATLPFCTVSVRGFVHRTALLGLLGVPVRIIEISRRADVYGRFSIPMNVGSVPADGFVTFEVQAVDPEGRTSQWTPFQYATGP